MSTEFKGTQGELELKYISGICIGIGTVGIYSQITANTILPDTDEDYENERVEIESNMLLYSKSPDLLNFIEEHYRYLPLDDQKKAQKLLKEATEINLL